MLYRLFSSDMFFLYIFAFHGKLLHMRQLMQTSDVR